MASNEVNFSNINFPHFLDYFLIFLFFFTPFSFFFSQSPDDSLLAEINRTFAYIFATFSYLLRRRSWCYSSSFSNVPPQRGSRHNQQFTEQDSSTNCATTSLTAV